MTSAETLKPNPSRPTTRLAPSPTGALHLGNARTFLINWALARQNDWRIVLRIDDLEGPRVKAGADVEAMEDLAWLGLTWEGGATYQSRRAAEYGRALALLDGEGRTFNCFCSRTDVARAARQEAADGSPLYPGTCRPRAGETRGEKRGVAETSASVRFRVPEAAVAFDDRFYGRQRFDAAADSGDFVVRKSDGEYGYQLATVVDDADAGVTEVVRGHDLLASTPRQILIYQALGLGARVPRYTHLPLVVGPDGRKLAKRHGDTRLRQLREQGVTAGQVRRLLATWSGLTPAEPRETSTQEWVESFDLDALPRGAVAYDDTRQRPRPL